MSLAPAEMDCVHRAVLMHKCRRIGKRYRALPRT